MSPPSNHIVDGPRIYLRYLDGQGVALKLRGSSPVLFLELNFLEGSLFLEDELPSDRQVLVHSMHQAAVLPLADRLGISSDAGCWLPLQ